MGDLQFTGMLAIVKLIGDAVGELAPAWSTEEPGNQPAGDIAVSIVRLIVAPSPTGIGST
ncbi:hypothetical protein [Skermanella sp. TT6]|uniref:hypothetical protein n=1 Tax=Skermanella cutis TaxID=2775420 RepID=UPI001FFF1D0F|nr:hypothetical protein [Skermanella sp. TT6]